jgi:hypothetical protein
MLASRSAREIDWSLFAPMRSRRGLPLLGASMTDVRFWQPLRPLRRIWVSDGECNVMLGLVIRVLTAYSPWRPYPSPPSPRATPGNTSPSETAPGACRLRAMPTLIPGQKRGDCREPKRRLEKLYERRYYSALSGSVPLISEVRR